MATVSFDQASRIFEAGSRPAVDALDLEITDGEFLVLVGPSGCGKSTSLRMLAGLEPTDEGHIRIDGKDVTGVRPRDRDVAMVFQSYALYPNMTARQNMAFALENHKLSRREITQRVDEAAKILQLQELLDRKPGKMSGGQRQRVAMGRAIVRQPAVFCMDEPLSNLDAKLRVSTRSEIAALQRRLGITTVYVTHDQTEAMTMGDRVAVLLDGRLQQVASPEELYNQPRNTFVAGFIGSPAITLIDGLEVREGAAILGRHRFALPARAHAATVTFGVRPESWQLVGETEPDAIALQVDLVEALGSEFFVYATPRITQDEAASVRQDRITVRLDKRTRPQIGDVLHVRPLADELHFFDGDSGLNLAGRD
ncbi:sugar ABC transporter ATP-binding protein [Enemella dayhoffiae]|uniref:Sugar ABC transporter ATP-binding protein n=1 Tax=Enemella dayhoffiae TaxID=2016507 RepID=A0A255GS48_9ACTN|nr:sn-glycerol-3-phosphate ABC transporter ATP-binding protein UgpC [Enemella dayhoffiae]OYO17233.1 sugar ABC transporter ATP-binding protein [Enemella dayhoffiae]